MDIHEQLSSGISNLQNKNAIRIYRSKNKIRRLLIGSFCTLGILVLVMLVAYKEDHSPDRIWGVIGVVFCAAIAILVIISSLPKLKQENPAIILDEKGITWNMNLNEPLRISSNDVVNIKSTSFRGMKFLVVEVNNSYRLKEGKKGLQSFFMQANEMIFGSPICFRASTLDVNFDKLQSLFNSSFSDWKKSK